MKAVTLDLLDRTLSSDYTLNIGADPDHRFTFYKETLLFDPNYWEKYYNYLARYSFTWQEFKYEKVAQNIVPLEKIINKNNTGVYLFIIKSNDLIYDLPKQVLYVGIAGENEKNRPLIERLNDYFYIEQIKKRKKVHMLLKKYYKNVYVAFSYLDIPFEELKQVEKYLHGFFYPIYCDRDFPTELKSIRKAFPR